MTEPESAVDLARAILDEYDAMEARAFAAEAKALEPSSHDLTVELRNALDLFAGSMSVTPKAAWEEAIERVRLLASGRCHACLPPADGPATIYQPETP